MGGAGVSAVGVGRDVAGAAVVVEVEEEGGVEGVEEEEGEEKSWPALEPMGSEGAEGNNTSSSCCSEAGAN